MNQSDHTAESDCFWPRYESQKLSLKRLPQDAAKLRRSNPRGVAVEAKISPPNSKQRRSDGDSFAA